MLIMWVDTLNMRMLTLHIVHLLIYYSDFEGQEENDIIIPVNLLNMCVYIGLPYR
jgi:uncharacterized membrane protein